MLAHLLLALAQEPLQIDGLRAGERFRALASSTEVIDTDLRTGRIVDAHTGFPVSDATIETWTEEISGAGPGFRRIGEARTARDGGFRVRIREGALEAEKMLVRARGYLTFPGTVGDLELVRLMPKPAWTPRLLVLDLEDRPIPGARVTTTYSCAHDVPAFDLATGPDGRVELPEYGLQDQPGELRIRAPGFAARKYVSCEEVPADPLNGHPVVLRLARQGGLRARVLSPDGEPLAGRALHVIDGEGFHVPTTDANGAFVIEACYAARESTIEVLAQRNQHVFSGELPRDREVALRVHSDRWPETTPVGTITVRTEQGAGERIDFGLFHSDGWALSSTVAVDEPRELEFPAGAILVLAGGPFGGWEPRLLEVELGAGATLDVLVTPDAECELEILTPPGEAQRVIVQAGERSIELEPENGRALTHVPRGVSSIVWSEGERDRRLVLRPGDGSTTADLRSPETLLPERRAQLAASAPREVLEVEVSGLAAGALTAKGPGEPRVREIGPGQFEVDAPAGYPLALRYVSTGHAQCWTSAHTGQERITLDPTPLADLTIENETGRELALEGPEAGELDGLHPGPLSLILTLGDGRRGLLSLELAPGEERVLRLRD